MAKKKSVRRKKTPEKQEASSLPFEKSIDQLRAAVQDLESGNLSLDESLEKYELGIGHLKACYKALKSAEHRIELLVDLDDEGTLVTEKFDGSATYQERPVTGAGNAEDGFAQMDDSEADSDEEMDVSDGLF